MANDITTTSTGFSPSVILNPDSMAALFRFAEMMAGGMVTVPDHLRGKPTDCLAITMQALRWGMDPFVVAQKTHVVSGRLGYEAQLVNAAVQSTGAIKGSFSYEFGGAGAAIECRVGAVLPGDDAVTWGEWLKASDVQTKNSPLWKVNPKQQLAYLQVKNWARLYCPGAILGVYTPDELDGEPMQTPARPTQPAVVVQAAALAAAIVPAMPAGLIERAEDAALGGWKAYADFGKQATADERKALMASGDHERLKAAAKEVDQMRTVEQVPPAAESDSNAKFLAELGDDV